MSLPISLHGNEYLEHLRDFRDAALVESHWLGRRRKLGAFTFGIAHARWQAEDRGTAHLIHEGLFIKNEPFSTPMPTTLRLQNHIDQGGIHTVTFKMDIDFMGLIDVYQNIYTRASVIEFAKADLYRRVERKHDLHKPTDEQRELLYTELQRGATGLYPITYDEEAN